MENASLLVQVSSFTYTTLTLQFKKTDILKRTTSDIFNVEKKRACTETITYMIYLFY